MIFWMKSGKDSSENEQGCLCCVAHEGDNGALFIHPHTVCYHLHSPKKNKQKKHLHPDGNNLFQDNTNVNHHWEGWWDAETFFWDCVTLYYISNQLTILPQASSQHRSGLCDFPIHLAAIRIYRDAARMTVCGVSKHFTFMTRIFSSSSERLAVNKAVVWPSIVCLKHVRNARSCNVSRTHFNVLGI